MLGTQVNRLRGNLAETVQDDSIYVLDRYLFLVLFCGDDEHLAAAADSGLRRDDVKRLSFAVGRKKRRHVLSEPFFLGQTYWSQRTAFAQVFVFQNAVES